jgi:hypothetical protein
MKQLFRRRIPLLATLFAFAFLFMFSEAAQAVDLTGSMVVSRAVKAGADECYLTIANVSAGDNIKALGRNASGTWVFIWADAGDGWVPTSSVNLAGDVQSLSVWTDHFAGQACQSAPAPVFDSRICGRPGNATSGTTTRWTDIFETADPATHTGRAYVPNTTVSISGRDFWGCWVSVSGAGDAGWVPVNALNERGVMDLPVLVDNSMGCTIDGGTVRCPQP